MSIGRSGIREVFDNFSWCSYEVCLELRLQLDLDDLVCTRLSLPVLNRLEQLVCPRVEGIWSVQQIYGDPDV